MRKALEIGGFIAAAVLIAFGVVAIVMGVNGRNTVNNSLSHEYITASTDMTPSAIKAEAKKDGPKVYAAVKDWPTMSLVTTVNGKPTGVAIDNGARARAMAQYMHIHALAATGGYTYAQMGIWQAKPGTPKQDLMPGGGTDNPQFAATDPTTKQPISNGARSVWVNETALATALNTSYMASQIALFGLVVGIALLLTGIGFAIIAGAGALRNPETILAFAKRPKVQKTPAVPVA
jgi:F0F1-type ATP synthase membrane subunit c/vacuolar-type H+-ATPase subunit K